MIRELGHLDQRLPVGPALGPGPPISESLPCDILMLHGYPSQIVIAAAQARLESRSTAVTGRRIWRVSTAERERPASESG